MNKNIMDKNKIREIFNSLNKDEVINELNILYKRLKGVDGLVFASLNIESGTVVFGFLEPNENEFEEYIHIRLCNKETGPKAITSEDTTVRFINEEVFEDILNSKYSN